TPPTSTLFPYTTLFRSVRSALNDVQSRLHAFARVHHMLTVPDFQTRMDAHTYLRELCDALWRSKLERAGIAIQLRSDPIMIGSRSEEHTSELQSLTNLV